MAIPPKAIYRLNVIPIESPMRFFTKLEQVILKLIWNHKSLNYQTDLRKKSKVGALPSQTLDNTTKYINENRMVLAQKQTFGPMERKREPRNEPTPLAQLTFDKGGKSVQWRRDSHFSKWCWESYSCM